MGTFQRRKEVLDSLVKKGLVLTVMIFNTLVDGYCRRLQDVDGAFAAMKRMGSLGL